MRPKVPAMRPKTGLYSTALLATAVLCAAAQASAYCNWNNCNGAVEGGDWCNESSERCRTGCGGTWCSGAVPGPSTPPAGPPAGDNNQGYCNWNNCNGVADGGAWCNESSERCRAGCGGTWCSSAVPGPIAPPTGPPAGDNHQGYCNWSNCNGVAGGGPWCNESSERCRSGCGGTWCVTTAPTGPVTSPSPPAGSPPASSPAPPPPPSSQTLKATHFWDCNGAACDAKTLTTPWTDGKNPGYRYAPQYAPLNPSDYGGASAHGEKMWLTGAASDALSAQMGPDDGCCGQDSEGIGGCGKCLLVTNPTAVNGGWKAIVMKKNRCPPWSYGCDKPHLDIAVPGYDNLAYSTANICGQPGTFLSRSQSSTCGSWYDKGSSTVQGCDCGGLPSSTPEQQRLKAGCELFTAWGWRSGDPQLTYEAVECPRAFKAAIQAAFGPEGPKGI